MNERAWIIQVLSPRGGRGWPRSPTADSRWVRYGHGSYAALQGARNRWARARFYGGTPEARFCNCETGEIIPHESR